MKTRIVSVTRKSIYFLSALIIFVAMMVLISRVLTPYVDARRGEIEKIASDLVQAPVKIESARISWFQYQPGVALQNVTILSRDSNEPVFQVRTVKIFFAIPKSLWQRKLVPSGMLVSGADLVVHQSTTGEFVIQGFPALGGFDEQPFQSESKIKDVLGVLLTQPLIILRDIDVRYTGMTGQKRFITLYNLKLENSDDSHMLLGKAILHQEISTGLSVAARWQGADADLQKISGKIYLNLSSMSLVQWLKGLSYKNWEIRKGLVSAKLWATWRNGGFQKIQTSVQLLNVDLYSSTDKSVHSISRLSGDLGWRREGSNQILAGDDILIDWATHLWPITSFYLKLTPDVNQQLVPLMLNIGYLNIADARDLLTASPAVLPVEVVKVIDDLDLSGNVENIAITFSGKENDWQPSQVQGHFNKLGFKSVRQLPAVDNVSGLFTWKPAEGSVTLQSHQTSVLLSSLSSKSISFEQLTGDVFWQHESDGAWKIIFKSIGGLNEDVALNINGDVSLPVSKPVYANVNANFTLHNLSHIRQYLPAKIMSKDLVTWLSSAFVTGDAQSGAIILRGPLAEFPFDKNQGLFSVTTTVNNVRLHYAPDWPDIYNISGNVQFIGRKIVIDVSRLQISGIDIGRTHGEIPYLGSDKPAILSVSTSPVHTDFTNGMKFLHQSPLEKTIGRMFRNVELSGPVTLDIALIVPLEKPDDTEVKGVIDIAGGNMLLVPWKLTVAKLNGKVNFTEKTTDGAGISGELFGKPLRLDLSSINKPDGKSVVVATVNNNIDLHDLESWLKIPFSAIAQGATNVTSKINLAVDQPIDVHIDTNLTGITLNLPLHYAKTADEVRPFNADIIVAENEPLKLKLDYAELLNAALILNRNGDSFDLAAADLRIGKGAAEWPKDKGLYITGTLSALNSANIKTYLDMSKGSSPMSLPLKSIDLMVDDLDLYGIKITSVRLQLVPQKSGWTVNVTSPGLTGVINIPSVFNSNSVLSVNLQRANLDVLGGGGGSKEVISARDLPAIKFSADNVSYGKAYLGSINLITARSSNGLAIQSLSLRAANFNLQASGDWVQSGKNNMTRLHGKANSKNVSAFLDALGFDVHNFVSTKGDFTFDLNWSSSPSGMSMQNLNGQATIEMGQGRIVEVSQAGDAKMDLGRMLNLFSLQSIPRRLSLDFSDVFMKGYSFDTLKADFKFSHGDAMTDNMRFDGPLARVEIKGKIGLAAKNFDLILSVTPYVTSSIPVAATLITGQPVIGVAAWAVNKMIGGEVSKVVTYYYSVTGSWVNPVWNQIRGMRGSGTQAPQSGSRR